MAEPGRLEWGAGSRVRLGSVLLTTARHTLGLSILRAGQWRSTLGWRVRTRARWHSLCSPLLLSPPLCCLSVTNTSCRRALDVM